MNYHFSKTILCPFEKAVEHVTKNLNDNGFGILSNIDVRQTLKKKLDVDFRNYRILGACNPKAAYKALQAEDKIGTMLPCNVILQEKKKNEIEVSAIDPVASMQAVENPAIAEVAQTIREKLKKVVDEL